MEAVIIFLAIAAFCLGFSITGAKLFISHKERVEAKKKREYVLRQVVRNHIESTANGAKPVPLQKLVKRRYETEEITPELLAYFEDNYSEFLIAESKQLEAERVQRIRQKEEEKKVENQMEEIEQHQAAQLEAFKTVKELSPQKNREVH